MTTDTAALVARLRDVDRNEWGDDLAAADLIKALVREREAATTPADHADLIARLRHYAQIAHAAAAWGFAGEGETMTRAAAALAAETARRVAAEKERDATDHLLIEEAKVSLARLERAEKAEAALAEAVAHLKALEKASTEVARYGAQTGSQWTRLTVANLSARAFLAKHGGVA